MLVGIAAAIGLGCAAGISAIGATVARRYDDPGIAWFTGYTTLVGIGLGLVSFGILTGRIPVTDFTGLVGRWLAAVWILPAALWVLFALQYTGRFVSLSVKTSSLIAFPFLVFAVQSILSGVPAVPEQLLGFAGIIVRYYGNSRRKPRPSGRG
jgi:hypothetical protein